MTRQNSESGVYGRSANHSVLGETGSRRRVPGRSTRIRPTTSSAISTAAVACAPPRPRSLYSRGHLPHHAKGPQHGDQALRFAQIPEYAEHKCRRRRCRAMFSAIESHHGRRRQSPRSKDAGPSTTGTGAEVSGPCRPPPDCGRSIATAVSATLRSIGYRVIVPLIHAGTRSMRPPQVVRHGAFHCAVVENELVNLRRRSFPANPERSVAAPHRAARRLPAAPALPVDRRRCTGLFVTR